MGQDGLNRRKARARNGQIALLCLKGTGRRPLATAMTLGERYGECGCGCTRQRKIAAAAQKFRHLAERGRNPGPDNRSHSLSPVIIRLPYWRHHGTRRSQSIVVATRHIRRRQMLRLFFSLFASLQVQQIVRRLTRVASATGSLERLAVLPPRLGCPGGLIRPSTCTLRPPPRRQD